MIKIEIHKNEKAIVYFKISGHANYGKYGEDIICASVSSVAQMVLNGLLEIVKLNELKYVMDEGIIICDLNLLDEVEIEKSDTLLKSMEVYLIEVAKSYPKNVKLIIREV